MTQEMPLNSRHLKTPRAAAVAGIAFSLLMITSDLLIWVSLSSDPLGPAAAVVNHSKIITLALNLVSFAGVAFLWFIGVVRDRLGELEDRFFATIFLGSGLLYIAMVFAGAAVAGGIIAVLGKGLEGVVPSGAYALGRVEANQAIHLYATKMAGVFMTSASAISLQTRIVPRWIAYLGYALATIQLLSFEGIVWVSLAFPVWVLLYSSYILIETGRRVQPPPPPPFVYHERQS